mgnify:CR=1 FL=1
MDYKLVTDPPRMTFYTCINGILNNVIMSLQVQRGSLFLLPAFGSHLNKITDTSDSSVAMARMYCIDALSWLIKIGKVNAIDVISSRLAAGISLDITITQINGEIVTYTYYHRIS